MSWWGDKAPRWAILAATLLLARLALAFVLDLGSKARSEQVRARLETGRADAAVASGQDAVEAVGCAASGETIIDSINGENERAIRSAQGAHAPVDPAVHDAGVASLCRFATYRSTKDCMQFTPAR